MRKTTLILALLLGCLGLNAQNYHINLHQSGNVIYDNDVNTIDDIRFRGSQPATMVINDANGGTTFSIMQFDSITFVKEELPPAGDTVYITYNGTSVEVINPFADDLVQITIDGGFVDVQSYRENVPYVVSGSSDNGRLIFYSMTPFHLTFDDLTLSNPTSAAIGAGVNVPVTLKLKGTSTLADGANGSQTATMDVPWDLTIEGPGTLQITGNAKHAMNIEGPITVNSGTIRILDSDSDGIHGRSDLTWN